MSKIKLQSNLLSPWSNLRSIVLKSIRAAKCAHVLINIHSPSSMLQSYWSMHSPMHCSLLPSLSVRLLLGLPMIRMPLISANRYSTTTCISRRSASWYTHLPISRKPLIKESSPEHALVFFKQQSRSIVWPLSHFWSMFNTCRQSLLTWLRGRSMTIITTSSRDVLRMQVFKELQLQKY